MHCSLLCFCDLSLVRVFGWWGFVLDKKNNLSSSADFFIVESTRAVLFDLLKGHEWQSEKVVKFKYECLATFWIRLVLSLQSYYRCFHQALKDNFLPWDKTFSCLNLQLCQWEKKNKFLWRMYIVQHFRLLWHYPERIISDSLDSAEALCCKKVSRLEVDVIIQNKE